VQRAHLERVPARLPAAVGAAAACPGLEHGDRLVDAAEHRVLALEDLHHDVRMAALGLQQPLRVIEVGVRVVAVADALLGQAEDAGREALASRHCNSLRRRQK
jgi:hypothetical protein